MALTFTSEFVFIGKGDESFLENYSYELSEDSGRSGKIYMALEILNNQAQAEDIGEAIFMQFKQKFYESVGKDPYDRFEAALKEANLALEAMKDEKVSRFIGNFNIALAAIAGDTLYLSATGDAEVYLLRKKFVSIVSEGLAEQSPKETFVNIASGTLEPGDTVILSSARLLRYITKAELAKICSKSGERFNIGDALANLQDFIMTEILGRSAVVGVSVGDDGAEEEEPVSEEGGMFEEEYSDKLPARSLFRVPEWLRKIPFLGSISSGVSGIFSGAGSFLKKIKMPKLGLGELSEKIKSVAAQAGKKTAPKPSLMPKIMGRERVLILIVILLIALVGGIFFVQGRSGQKALIQEQQAKLNHVREVLNESFTVGQFDKTKAAELLTAGEKETVEVLNSGVLRSDAVKMLDEIQKNRDTLDEVKRITAPTVVADLSEKRSTVSALGLLNFKDRLFAFEYNALYELVLDRLQDPLTIDSLETVILGTPDADRNTLLFLTRTGKMIEFANNRFDIITTKDGLWKKGVDIKTYNERVYILDAERNQIWRYNRGRDSFAASEGYNQDADLSKAVALAIDSSVYVMNADGTVIQLYQGKKQDYPLRRPPLAGLSEPTKLFTNANLNYLFILEPNKKRVIVFRKDEKNGGAQYQTQYVFDNVGMLRDLVVTDNRLYVMDDKKIYMVNLSGL